MIKLWQTMMPDSVNIAQRAFDINPSNLYAFVVGALVIVIGALAYVIIRLWGTLQGLYKENKDMASSLATVVINNTHVIERISERVDGINQNIRDSTDAIKEAIRASEERITIKR